MLSDDQTAALVNRARRGESEAFEMLARAYLRAAYSVALAVVRRPADAEDVAQNAMLLAFERIETCREPARFGGWLLQIVRNQANNWLSARRLRDVAGDADRPSQPSSEPLPDRSVAHRQLLVALETLSPVEREVVLLHDLEGWTHKEIATALSISEAMSRQHLFQARKELRAELSDRPSQEPCHG